MISPQALEAGDTIAIISTARKISKKELEPAIQEITSRGFKVHLGKNLFKKDHQFSGTDAQRAEDLQCCLDSPHIKAILCARGGYGTVRIIDQIDFNKFKKSPKWVCGYSDVTVLHNKISALGIESLHSTMPINFATNTTASLNSLFDLLKGESTTYETGAHRFNKPGQAEGILTGGNLSMIYSQCGSDSSLRTDGAILFLEDLDEYLYHIDRMMCNLKRNGYFDKLSGVIIGSMTDMNDNTIPFGHTAEEIIHHHFADYNFPVCYGFPAGHIDHNRTLVLGRKVLLNVGKTTTLKQ